MNEFNLCITFDTDADPQFENHKNSVTFKNLQYNLDNLSNNIDIIQSKLNKNIPISWFVRLDNQINDIYGEYDWILNKYSNFWSNELNKKNEIHWHAHIYQKIGNQWLLPKTDELFINYFSQVNNYVKKNYSNINCVRIGEAYMTNNIMNFLKEINLKADSSCIPGRKRIDDEKYFDWSNSPNHPYFPSKKNYQLENKENNRFLEIPMNTIETKCLYDKSNLLRYANLAFRNDVIYKGLKKYIKENDLLVTISHPYEFFDEFSNNINLFQNNISILETNISSIVKICKELDKKINFISINDVINKFIHA